MQAGQKRNKYTQPSLQSLRERPRLVQVCACLVTFSAALGLIMMTGPKFSRMLAELRSSSSFLLIECQSRGFVCVLVLTLGAYMAPPSIGKQAQSKNRSPATPSMGTAPRLVDIETVSPGPGYLPKTSFLSSTHRIPDLSFPVSERPSLAFKSPSPGPVYSPSLSYGKRMPAFGFPKSKRF